MAQLTGKLLANFDSFFDACEKAKTKLVEFQDGADKVGPALTKMTDSFSGRKLIQDATLMTEAVTRIGGVTRLTEAELARVSATATEAVAKMKALGIDVPPEMQKLASSVQHAKEELGGMEGSAVRTGKATQGLGDQLAQVDGVLGAMGVHLGPEVKALRELGEHSDKTASQLGALGTVALAAGAAIGGWKLGRLIAEFTGSDEAIGNATAKLLGWTTAAGGAGSASDTLARASAIAGRNVVSLADALQINTDAVHKWQGEMSRAHAAEDNAKEVAHWRAELQALGSGVLSSLQKDLDSHNFSQANLAKNYGVSTEALGLLSRQMQRHKEVMADVQAAQEKFTALQDHLFGRDLTAKAQEYARAIGDVANASRLIPPVAAEVNAVMKSAYDVLVKAGRGASEAAVQFRELAIATTNWAAINAKLAALPDPFALQNKKRSDAFRTLQIEQMNLNQGITDSQLYWKHAGEIADESMQQASDAVKSVVPPTNDAASAVKQQFTAAFQSASSAADQFASHAAAALSILQETNAYKKAGFFINPGFGTADTINRQAASVPRFAAGTSYAPGGAAVVGERGPELINLPRGSRVTPNGQWGGVTVNIGTIHASSAHEGRAAADAIVAQLKAKGIRI